MQIQFSSKQVFQIRHIYIIKSIKCYILIYEGYMHMHEYSKIYVDRHIDIEIILHHVKGMIIPSVVW